MAIFKNTNLATGKLRRKLRVAFCLMSVLPLMVAFYIVANYVLPRVGFKIDNASITISVVISSLIAVIGFFLIKQVFDRIVNISSEVKLIADGDMAGKIQVSKDDELGFLEDTLNQLTMRIRKSMDELKGYSERTSEINVEIQKRVLALSSLLQISSIISQGAKLDEVLHLAVEKSRILANSDTAFILFLDKEGKQFQTKVADGLMTDYLYDSKIPIDDPLLVKAFKANKPVVVDSDNPLPHPDKPLFPEQVRLKNSIMLPVFLKGKLAGLFGIGTNKDRFVYRKEDIELLDIFVKQVTIAMENDLLSHSVEKLEIKDALTGLYNERFIHGRLQEEIKRAIIYQRPCAFIMLNIDDFKAFHREFGALQSEGVIKRVSSLIRESITEVDRAARTGDNEFAVVLPERNKRNAQVIAEDIRKKIEGVFSPEKDIKRRVTVSAGISENPLDGVDADELFTKARQAVVIAKAQGKNRVI